MTPREWPDRNWMRAQDLAGSFTDDKLLNVGKIAASLAAAEERGRRAALAGCVPVPAEMVRKIVRALEQHSWRGERALAAKLQDLAPRDSGGQPARMDAPDGPQCWCGMPSTRENGWCGTCNFAKDRK